MKFGTVTHIGPYGGQTVKISNFSKTKMAAAAILKITKIAISPQQFDRSLRNLARLCKIGWISEIQDGGRPLIWKPLNRHISATVWPILMKFGKVTHIGPRTSDWPLKFLIFENPRWRNKSNNLQPKVKRKYWYIKWSVLHVHKFKRKKIKKQI